MSLDQYMESTMGTEYRIEFQVSDREAVFEILRSLGFAPSCQSRSDSVAYEFRDQANDGLMPNASTELDDGGLYFGDFGGTRNLLEQIGQRIAKLTGAANVSEID